MSLDYAALASTALASIKEAGFKLPIKRVSGTFDPVEGEVTASSLLSGELDAVTLPASAGTVQAFDNRPLDDLIRGKLRFFIAAASSAPFVPQANDIITFEGETWTIMGCTPLAPAGTPLIYRFGARRR